MGFAYRSAAAIDNVKILPCSYISRHSTSLLQFGSGTVHDYFNVYTPDELITREPSINIQDELITREPISKKLNIMKSISYLREPVTVLLGIHLLNGWLFICSISDFNYLDKLSAN